MVDSFGMLLDAAPPDPINTSSDGFVILLIALVIVLIVSFIFCVSQVKKAKEKKKLMEQSADEGKESTDDKVQ